MSLTSLPAESKEAIERRKIALFERIRRNFWFKFISLATAILLYFYVQGERNPNVTHTFSPPVLIEHKPDDVDVQADAQKVKINVSGPRSVMDIVKDGEIRLIGNFQGTPIDKVSSQQLRCRYDFIGSAAEHRSELTLDPPDPGKLTFMVYPQRTTAINVRVHYLREAPEGYRYNAAEVSPPKVKVSGRLDRVERVEEVLVNAVRGDGKSSIEGDFNVSPRDHDGNLVEGVVCTPSSVHVTIPLVVEPYSKIVSISPNVRDTPPAGVTLYDIQATPIQVRITGKPNVVNGISTLKTQAISLHDRTEDIETDVDVLLPEGITVRTLEDKPLRTVHVRVALKKVVSPTSLPNTSGTDGSGNPIPKPSP